MKMGKEAAADARSVPLASILQGIDRKHQNPPQPARQTHGVSANRQIEVVPLARLIPFKRNARTHSPQQLRRIGESISEFGFLVPVLVNADNEIVAGHARVEAAKLIGLTELPVLRVNHLSPAEQRAFVIADNRLAELAGWDRDTLAVELQDLIELDFAVEVTGFDIGEIELILTLPVPRRIRDREHVKAVAKQPCLVCGRRPADAHHLRLAQPSTLGRKVSDEFTVPLCRGHHRELHRCGDEVGWWNKTGIDPTAAARALWLKTHPLPRIAQTNSRSQDEQCGGRGFPA